MVPPVWLSPILPLPLELAQNEHCTERTPAHPIGWCACVRMFRLVHKRTGGTMCGMCGDYPQGKMFTHKLEPPTTTLADAKEHAERLTRECRQALRGGRPRGFGGPGSPGGPKGPISYPKNTGYF
jgi:hypothetical protein